jgi:phospholipase/carboxylesterase
MSLQVLERRPSPDATLGEARHSAEQSGERGEKQGEKQVGEQRREHCAGVVVLLHGWGANAQDLLDLAPLLQMPDYWFLFPNAPIPHPYSLHGRMWYDLESPDFKGLGESRQLLADWLQTLPSLTGLSPERMVLGGFSQGGAMTLEVGLTLPETLPLAGLLVLSGYLHPHFQTRELSPFPPVEVIHGQRDTVVPIAAAHQIESVILRKGGQVRCHEFDMGHEINPGALAIARDFLIRCLPPKD